MEDQDSQAQIEGSGEGSLITGKRDVPPALAKVCGRTQFKPGQSGNPGGRPKTRLARQALLRVAKAKPGKKLVPRNQMEEWAFALTEQARKGNITAFKEIVDRIDGKVVPSQEELEASRQPLQVVISQGLRPRHEELPASTDSSAEVPDPTK